MTLRGKIIDRNNFKTDILADAIEKSRLDFEDTRYEKGELSKPKYFSHESGLNGKTAYTNTSRKVKTVVVCPYLMS